LNFFGALNIAFFMNFRSILFLPPSTQMSAQQLASIQQLVQSLTQAPQAPRGAAMIVALEPEADRPRCFRKCDDERLRAIMKEHPGRLSELEWKVIAVKFGRGATPRQLQERWYNFAKPGLDPAPFTASERRQVAALAIDHPHDWKFIATQLGNGEYRSATMVKQCGLRIIPKLQEMGFDIESASDIALVPEAVFERGIPKGEAREALLAEYRANKARQAGEAAATCPLDVESLMSKPLAK
jgi:hypothetical protein